MLTDRQPLTAREHLGLVLESARLRMGSFLLAARRLGWLSAQHSDDRWPWPSLSTALCALQGGAPLGDGEPIAPGQDHVNAQFAAIAARVGATYAAGQTLPLVELIPLFQLEPYDADVVVLALATELDPAFRAALQLWRREPDAASMDVDTALQVLGNEPGPSELSYRRAFEPRRPLVEHRLIELGVRTDGRRTLYRLADSVVRFLLGDPTAGSEVQRLARFDPAPVDPLGGSAAPPAVHTALERLVAVYTAPPAQRPAAFHVLGPNGSARRSVVQAAAARLGLPLLSVDLGILAAYGVEIGDVLRRIRRDALLTGALLHVHVPDKDGLVRLEDLASPEPAPPVRAGGAPAERDDDPKAQTASAEASWALTAVQHHLALAPRLVTVTGVVGTALFVGSRRAMGVTTRRLTRPESTRVMETVVGAVPDARAELLREVVESFTLTAGDVAYACRGALLDAEIRSGASTTEADGLAVALAKSFQQRAHSQLTSFAERVRTRAAWTDVVLSEAVTARLRELASFAAYHDAVFYEWGFDASMPSGRALTALFAGPSGTGKTLVAGVIAKELHRPLYRVDLSRVVSKYIGETEKQLGKIFDEADRERAVLLFDEADSIFSKRTDVQSSTDRYANATVNYLLQRLDSFEGVAILTTNKKDAIDPALRRRIKYHIEFELPDATAREQLWETHIPRRAPIEGTLNLRALAASADISGASIRNAVLRACLAAATERRGLTQELLLSAVERECEDLGKLLRRS